MTLEEFFKSHPALEFLVENLNVNMDVYCDSLDLETQEGFMRANLTMVRQCIEQIGNE